MKNCFVISAVLLAAVAFCGKVSFPLEWNVNRDTSIPYEVEIDRARLAGLTGSPQDAAFTVTADVGGKKERVPVTLLPGELKNTVALRFKVPAGTTALECTAEGSAGTAVLPESENLFAGVLKSKKSWWHHSAIKFTPTAEGVVLENTRWGEYAATVAVNVPPEFAGKPVRFEMDVKSLSPMPWSNINRIDQLDAKGNVLPECAVRQDWLSHMRPYGVLSKFRENGRLRPDTRKLRLMITMRNIRHGVGLDGLTLLDPKACHAKLEISRLELRCGEELPFPRYSDRFFAEGVSGRKGDYSLRMSDGDAFFYPVGSQAVWGDTRQVRDPYEFYFPIGEGTVEMFLKPEPWSYVPAKTHIILMQAYHSHASRGAKSVPDRRELFELRYFPDRKKIGVLLKDGKDRKYERSVPAELPAGKWSHVAVQWSKSSGVQIFVDGKRLLDEKNWSYIPLDISKESHPNAVVPVQITVGCTNGRARGDNTYSRKKYPDYLGLIDSIRTSSVVRYKGDFTPQKELAIDRETRSFFSFDRTFDGISGAGQKFINGTTRSKYGRSDNYLDINGKKVAYVPLAIVPENHPAKVLDPVNYPVLPTVADFKAARKHQRIKVETMRNKVFEVNIPQKVRMDYIEITNHPGTGEMSFPIVINEGEVDSRSFTDIRESLKLDKLSERDRVDALFRFVLKSSDYFMNHQADFPAGSNTPVCVEYLALSMLNGYCGFECGPLNGMVANLFTASGNCPARLIGSYAHMFEGVHYNNKTRVYDLSAQKFFPSFDNVSAATLDEIDDNAGLLPRVGSSPNHFIRYTTRGGAYLNNPSIQPKVGIRLNPRETFRIYFTNDGTMNDLQYEPRAGRNAEKWDYTAKSGAEKTVRPVWKIDRFFPHVANAFIFFNGLPNKNNSAFTAVGADSFCYRVRTTYPIVAGEYSATAKDGSSIELEYSTDRGKKFKPVKMVDGKAVLDYEIRARHEIWIRVKAPVSKVANIYAATQLMMNPRILTGILKPGKNKLMLKASGSGRARVAFGYSTDAKEITISGGVHTGTIPGYERQLVAANPGETLKLDVSGASANAKIHTEGNIKAVLTAGKLEITPDADAKPHFAEVRINDDGAEKKLVVLVGKGIRMFTAKDMKNIRRSKLVKAGNTQIQDTMLINDGGLCEVKFPTLPAGKYTVWYVNRFDSRLAPHGLVYRPLRMQLPDGREIAAGSAINPACDFYKAQYGKAGERGRFKWDFALRDDVKYPYMRPKVFDFPAFDKLTFRSEWQVKGIEIAAVLIVPEPSTELLNDMLKVLCGLNNDPWGIKRANNSVGKY